MHEIDPELSASSGLTNDVCGRLSIFTSLPSPSKSAPATTEEAAGICSALPTPSKVLAACVCKIEAVSPMFMRLPRLHVHYFIDEFP